MVKKRDRSEQIKLSLWVTRGMNAEIEALALSAGATKSEILRRGVEEYRKLAIEWSARRVGSEDAP